MAAAPGDVIRNPADVDAGSEGTIYVLYAGTTSPQAQKCQAPRYLARFLRRLPRRAVWKRRFRDGLRLADRMQLPLARD